MPNFIDSEQILFRLIYHNICKLIIEGEQFLEINCLLGLETNRFQQRHYIIRTDASRTGFILASSNAHHEDNQIHSVFLTL